MTPYNDDSASVDELIVTAQAAARNSMEAERMLKHAPSAIIAKLPSTILDDAARAAANESWCATRALCGMPRAPVDARSDDARFTLARSAVQKAYTAADALCGMPPETVKRLPKSILVKMARNAAQTSGSATRALLGMSPDVMTKLSGRAIMDLVEIASFLPDSAAQTFSSMAPTTMMNLPFQALRILAERAASHLDQEGWSRIIDAITPMVQSDDAEQQSFATRFIGELTTADALIAFVQTAPQEALTHNFIAALFKRARAGIDTAPLISVLTERIELSGVPIPVFPQRRRARR
jgi:uncharacterized protein GlcG (DUF336 family)